MLVWVGVVAVGVVVAVYVWGTVLGVAVETGAT